jgi:hypothetical protein
MRSLKNLEDCKAGLTQLGAEFHQIEKWDTNEDGTRELKPRPYFSAVKLPLSPVQWFGIASNAGNFYIGGCCGSASQIQDIVCSWFRHADEWVKPIELAELAERQANHHEPEQDALYYWDAMDDDKVFALVEKYGAYQRGDTKIPGDENTVVDPWFVICLVWHLVKNHYVLAQPESALPDHISPLDKSLRIVEHVSFAYSMKRIFSKADSAPKIIPDGQEKANLNLAMYRFIPAIKHVYEEAHKISPGPFNGWAVIDKTAGEKGLTVVKNGGGYCLYETKEEIEGLFDRWQKQQDETRDAWNKQLPVRERLGIRPVRVTLEDGLVFTDTGEKYEGLNA